MGGEILRLYSNLRKQSPEYNLLLMIGYLLQGKDKVGISVTYRRMQMELRHSHSGGVDVYWVLVAYDAYPNMDVAFRATFSDENLRFEYLSRGVWEAQLETWYDMERRGSVLQLGPGDGECDDQC